MSKLAWRENSPYNISVHLVQEYVITSHRYKTANGPSKLYQRYIKGCRAHLCHLPGLGQVGHPPKGNHWECWNHELRPNMVGHPVLPLLTVPPYLFPLDGWKRVGNGGSWWLIPSVTSETLRIHRELPYHGQ